MDYDGHGQRWLEEIVGSGFDIFLFFPEEEEGNKGDDEEIIMRRKEKKGAMERRGVRQRGKGLWGDGKNRR